jgi:dihydroflavonol-4-reductase
MRRCKNGTQCIKICWGKHDMARAVVTGATGFIGTHLVSYLRSLNWDVIAVARRTSNIAVLNSLGAHVVRADITDRSTMMAGIPTGIDVLFHLSCAPFASGLQTDNLSRVNEDGLRNSIFAATEKKVTCLVYMSDAIVYGERTDIIHEKTELAQPLALPSAYAKSRRECEAIFGRAIARGLDAVSVMPGAVLGHGLRQYRMRPFEAVLNQATAHAPSGGRNFVDVASVVRVLVRAAERGMTGQRYFVGGPYQSWEDILQRFIDINGLSTKITKVGPFDTVAKMFRRLAPSSKAIDPTDDWMWARQLHLSAEISQNDLEFQPGDIDAALKSLYTYVSAS